MAFNTFESSPTGDPRVSDGQSALGITPVRPGCVEFLDPTDADCPCKLEGRWPATWLIRSASDEQQSHANGAQHDNNMPYWVRYMFPAWGCFPSLSLLLSLLTKYHIPLLTTKWPYSTTRSLTNISNGSRGKRCSGSPLPLSMGTSTSPPKDASKAFTY